MKTVENRVKMYVCQITKRRWYIDAIVQELEDLPIRYLISVREVGKCSDEVNLRGIIIGVQRNVTSDFRRGTGMLSNDRVGEKAEKGVRRLLIGLNDGHVWVTGIDAYLKLRDILQTRRGQDVENSMEPRTWGQESRDRRGRPRMSENLMDDTLKIDIDVDMQYYCIVKLLIHKQMMLESLGYKVVYGEAKPSPSGRHVHIIFKLQDPVPIAELFYLQFLLGDDPKRAEFNFFRLEHFPEVAKYFNVLFEEKKKLSTWDKIKVIARAIYKKIKR